MKYPLLSLKKMDPAMLLFELQEITSRMSANDARMVMSAAQLATYLHRDQRRYVRDGMPSVPYIEHPMRNALRLHRWGSNDPHLISAALLHDVVEDCSTELVAMDNEELPRDATRRSAQHTAVSELREMYGSHVANMVADMTNGYYHPKDTYIEHIRREHRNLPFLLLKASDLHDNAGSLKHQVGGMSNEKILKRLNKYTPAVDEVTNSLQNFAQSTSGLDVLTNCHQAMVKLNNSLPELKERLTPSVKLSDLNLPQTKPSENDPDAPSL